MSEDIFISKRHPVAVLENVDIFDPSIKEASNLILLNGCAVFDDVKLLKRIVFSIFPGALIYLERFVVSGIIGPTLFHCSSKK